MDRIARLRERGSSRAFALPVHRSLAALLALGLAASCGSSELADRGSETGPGTPSSVQAQQDEPDIDLPGRISVLVRVLDENSVPVGGIAAEEFNIFEDGQLVSQTESFQRIVPRPERFRSYQHLIIDRSNSVQSAGQAAIIEAATEYINRVVGSDANAVESFVKLSWFDGSDGLYEVEGHELGFSNDAAALVDAVEALFDEPIFNPSTNLYGAVLYALDDLEDVDAEAVGLGIPNRALTLVTFTDGTHQTGDNATLDQVVTKLTSPTYTFNSFTIGVGSEIDPFVLGEIGRDGSVAVANFEDLVGAFEQVVDGIESVANSFYYLSYCSPKTSGPWDLAISLRSTPGTAQTDAILDFDATGFGAGCAFLDVERHRDAAGNARGGHRGRRRRARWDGPRGGLALRRLRRTGLRHLERCIRHAVPGQPPRRGHGDRRRARVGLRRGRRGEPEPDRPGGGRDLDRRRRRDRDDPRRRLAPSGARRRPRRGGDLDPRCGRDRGG